MRSKLTFSLLIVTLAVTAIGVFTSISGKNVLASELKQPEETASFEIHLFESLTCPHCRREIEFFEEIAGKYPSIVVKAYEVSQNEQNLKLLVEVGKALDVNVGGIPFLVIGEETIIGFGSPETTGVEIMERLDATLSDTPNDVVKQILEENSRIKPVFTIIKGAYIEGEPEDIVGEDIAETEEANENEGNESGGELGGNETIEPEESSDPAVTDDAGQEPSQNKPVFELKLDPEVLPLPVFTFFIALMDGFNPCAMWALLFLISVLLRVDARKKMWLLGGTFILTSGVVYFLFLAAWLNFFLIVGYAMIVRYLVGAFALGLGAYYLYDFYKNKGGCVVTSNEKRRNVLERIKQVVLSEHLGIAILGMIVLAGAVNMIELLCSAGLPAVYTKVLSMSDLPTWQYYLYLVFYIIIFMLDDMVVFIGAMITMEAFGIKNKYAKYSHLVGGIIVFLIGLALIFKPELLSLS